MLLSSILPTESVILVVLLTFGFVRFGSSLDGSEGRPPGNSSSLVKPLPPYVQVWEETKLIPVPDGNDTGTGNGRPASRRDHLTEMEIRELEREAEDEEELWLSGREQNGVSPAGLEDSQVAHVDLSDVTLPEDISDLSDEIVDEIAAGVEESLLLSAGKLNGDRNGTSEVETRQFPIYMFQGSYMPEPRLNRFIDGAIRNMGTELRISVMDPLYFRVLPKGRLESRPEPVKSSQSTPRREGRAPAFITKLGKKFINKINPFKAIKNRLKQGQRRRRRRRPNKNKVIRRKVVTRRPVNRRRKPGSRVRIKTKKPGGVKVIRKQKFPINRNRLKNRRQKRRIRRHVGGGRVGGLSCVTRDGDAEMQVFGNYTLVRSHMKMGPIDLAMQFRTQRGLRRTGTTLPYIRVHTVTRVSQDGSEMIDFLMDRPHPESIKVRGRLFPMAQRVARNIFSRLFLPNSFLVSQLREKAGLALLSRPKK